MRNGQRSMTQDEREEYERHAVRGAAQVILSAFRKADTIAMMVVANRHKDELDEVSRRITELVGRTEAIS